MISITIYSDTTKQQQDFMVNEKLKIKDVLDIIKEHNILMVEDAQYLRLKIANKVINENLTFKEADIYDGEKIVVK